MRAIEDACGRIQHLVSSGYLPDSLKRDLQLLTQAAMSWDAHLKRGSTNNSQDIPAVVKGARKARDAGRVEAAQQTTEKVEDGRAKQFTIPPAIAKALGMTVNQG